MRDRLLAQRLLATLLAVVLLVAALAGLGCDRKVEPFDPDEQPHRPDLSKIFPEGADRAARVEPGLPAAPPERGAPPMAAAAAGPAAEAGAPISGTVRLAGDLGAAPPRGAVLFIIARRGESGPPLAVKRVPDPTLPFEFSIGPDDRMIQAMPFVGPIQLSARMDADGNAMSRTPGDLEGRAAAPVSPGDEGIDLVLDEVL